MLRFWRSRIFLGVPETQNCGEENPVSENDEQDPELNELQDIEDILNRETADGPGDDEAPPADFESFATEGVEIEEDN